MSTTLIHICLETEDTPVAGVDHEVGERWVCACGANYVYHEGFNRNGGLTNAWFPAPAIPRPRGRIGNILFGPRQA